MHGESGDREGRGADDGERSGRPGRTCRYRKNRGNTRYAASGTSHTSAAHTTVSATTHTTLRRERPERATQSPRGYTTPSTPASTRASSDPFVSRTRATTRASRPPKRACRPTRSPVKTGARGRWVMSRSRLRMPDPADHPKGGERVRPPRRCPRAAPGEAGTVPARVVGGRRRRVRRMARSAVRPRAIRPHRGGRRPHHPARRIPLGADGRPRRSERLGRARPPGDRLVLHPVDGASATFADSAIEADTVAAWRAAPGVDTVTPVGITQTRAEGPGASTAVALFGLDAGTASPPPAATTRSTCRRAPRRPRWRRSATTSRRGILVPCKRDRR